MNKQDVHEKAAFIISRIDEYMPENVNPHYWIKVGFDIAYQQALKDYFTLIGCTDEHQ
jgi:hypothetical protein